VRGSTQIAHIYESSVKVRETVTPLVLQVYIWDHMGSLDNPNIDTQSELMRYHSDLLIRSSFRICSPIGIISITLPVYQLTNDSDHAERKKEEYYL
jgi:hypothetical protein